MARKARISRNPFKMNTFVMIQNHYKTIGKTLSFPRAGLWNPRKRWPLPHAHLGTVRRADRTGTQSSFDSPCETWEIATMR